MMKSTVHEYSGVLVGNVKYFDVEVRKPPIHVYEADESEGWRIKLKESNSTYHLTEPDSLSDGEKNNFLNALGVDFVENDVDARTHHLDDVEIEEDMISATLVRGNAENFPPNLVLQFHRENPKVNPTESSRMLIIVLVVLFALLWYKAEEKLNDHEKSLQSLRSAVLPHWIHHHHGITNVNPRRILAVTGEHIRLSTFSQPVHKQFTARVINKVGGDGFTVGVTVLPDILARQKKQVGEDTTGISCGAHISGRTYYKKVQRKKMSGFSDGYIIRVGLVRDEPSGRVTKIKFEVEDRKGKVQKDSRDVNFGEGRNTVVYPAVYMLRPKDELELIEIDGKRFQTMSGVENQNEQDSE